MFQGNIVCSIPIYNITVLNLTITMVYTHVNNRGIFFLVCFFKQKRKFLWSLGVENGIFYNIVSIASHYCKEKLKIKWNLPLNNGNNSIFTYFP